MKQLLMNEVTVKLQREAERIAAKHHLPEFYVRFKAPIALARKLFFNDPMIVRLRDTVQPLMQEELGHGIFHCTHVSLDTAVLIYLETEQHNEARARVERLMLLGLAAGLLHDIRRNEENHARAGAVEAAKLLKDFPLTKEEVQCICGAIENHEAFCTTLRCARPWCQLLSDCLYDADKFRWGPDTFTHTLWFMVSHQGLTPQQLIDKFPWGITGILRILDTFRTPTGRQYGPEIVETGIEIGKELYRYLLRNFGGDRDDH